MRKSPIQKLNETVLQWNQSSGKWKIRQLLCEIKYHKFLNGPVEEFGVDTERELAENGQKMF